MKKMTLTEQTFNKSIKGEHASYSVSAQIKDIDTLCWGWMKMHCAFQLQGKHLVKITYTAALKMSWWSISFKME